MIGTEEAAERTDSPVRNRVIGFCVGLVAAGSVGCAQVDPDRAEEVSGVVPPSALLSEVRKTTEDEGLVAARDLVAEKLADRDDSHGALEKRVIKATKDPDLVFPDSLVALSRAERGRIAIIIVPGTQIGFGGPSMTRQTLREAARASEALGFSTHFIDTPPRGGVAENAVLVAEEVAPIFEEADQVILLALSKGAHDLIYYLQEYALELPEESREKLKAVISLAGTLQGSVVAEFFATGSNLVPAVLRLGLHLQGNPEQVNMLKTLARSPWRSEDAPRLVSAFPEMTWVSVAMVPDGEDGMITERLWSPFLRKRIARSSPDHSPDDGLVESAAAVLPDDVEVPEWIVRGFGSHSMPNGRYIDGTRIAPQTTEPGEETLKPVSGGEVMNIYLRALPQSLLSGNR